MIEKLLSAERKITSSEKCTQSESFTMFNGQTIELNFVHSRLEQFQATVLHDVQKRTTAMIDEIMQELRQHELQINEFRNFVKPQMAHQKSSKQGDCMCSPNGTAKNAKASKEEFTNGTDKNDNTTNDKLTQAASENGVINQAKGVKENSRKNLHVLPDKVLVTRESFLTALLEVDHMKTIYHIFYIIFIAFLLNNITYEYFVNGSISFGLGTFKYGFENLHNVFGVWMAQHVFVFGIYYALHGWSHIRLKLAKQKTLQHLWSISCLLVYIATQLTFAYIPTKICLKLNLSFVTASILLLESIRLLMKMHAFVRTVAARVVAGKEKTDDNSGTEIVILPAFKKYLYYLFAPTLLYRDNYPRTSTIRWKYALARLLEVVAVAFLYSYIYNRHIKHHFGHFGREELNINTVTVKLFSMLMPCVIIYLAGFYMILHAWLNFTAELLRFGDRMFYRDWWTASNYETYYRNWNVIVHNWLYEYIYKDAYNHIFKGSKVLSSIMVFSISALFHEYVLGYALQVVFPVMFIFFGVIGVAMVFLTRYIPKNLGNIVLWFTLVYGNCLMISLYSMEYFARINCPKEFKNWSDCLVPHIWSCYHK